MNDSQVHFVSIPRAIWNTKPADRPLVELAKDALAAERRIYKGVNLDKERPRYTQICNRIESVAMGLVQKGQAGCMSLHGVSDGYAPTLIYLHLIGALQTAESDDVNQIVKVRERSESLKTRVQAFLTVLLHELRQDLFLLWRATPDARRARQQIAVAFYRLVSDQAARQIDKASQLSTLGYDRVRPIGKSFYPPGAAVAQQRLFFEHLRADTLTKYQQYLHGIALHHCLQVARDKADFYLLAEREGNAVVEVVSMPGLG